MSKEELEKKRNELREIYLARLTRREFPMMGDYGESAVYNYGFQDCADLLMPEIGLYEVAASAANEEIKSLRAQLAERDKEIERLKARTCSHGDYKVWGTDGCSSCDTGRITVYTLEEKCLKCQGR